MAVAVTSGTKSVTAHVLAIGIVGIEEQLPSGRTKAIEQLDRLVQGTMRFRVAEVGSKVVRQETSDGSIFAFLSDAKTAFECAIEIARESKGRPEISLRMGLDTGAVIYDTDPTAQTAPHGEGIELAQRIMQWGDADHILLSKRIAYELAADSRWDPHFYELGESSDAGGKTSLVNFYSDEVGSPELPSKIRRQRAQAARRAKLRSLQRPALIVLAVLLVSSAIAAGYLFVRQALKVPALIVPPEEKSIAVLPFLDLSPARDREYLADGITEEILKAVARMKSVRVVGRSSAFAFKGRNLDPREVAVRLNVGMVLQGSVRRSANSLGITVELLNGRNGSQLWSKGFERDIREIPKIVDEIIQAIAVGLHVAPVGYTPSRAWDDPLTSDLYLQGLFLSHKKDSEDLQASLDFFRLALARDSRLSGAWTNSARDRIQLGENGRIRPLDCYSAAQDAAAKALAIDPGDAAAHVYMGETKRVLGWDLGGDEAELKRALQIDPHCVVAHLYLALLQTWMGVPAPAADHIETAAKFDPYSPLVGHVQVITDLMQDRFKPAFAAVQAMMDTDPNYTYFEPDLALVYREQGKLHEALEIYLRLDNARPQPGLAITYARLNRPEDAEKVLAELLQKRADQYIGADRIAAVYAALGQPEQAFEWLNRAADEHSSSLHELGCSRDFRALRSDARYAGLLQRIRLDPKRFPPQ